jgi:peptide/nickel transport system ATP-binding protein
MNMSDALLTIDDLKTHFVLDEGVVRAVDGVSLCIPRGGTVSIVGESGCGKSVTAFSILRLVAPPGRIVGGRVVLHGAGGGGDVVLTDLREDGSAMRRIRGGRIAMIFQEPMTSLSPVHAIGAQIVEAVRLHAKVSGAHARRQAVDMMRRVGVPDAERRFDQYPHELSGGLRQRAMIAMALVCRPQLLIADEPTTALDVTIQAQILQLIRDLQAEMGMSVLLITHDLGVVAEMARHVAVMYRGRIVEQGPVDAIFHSPAHPYTRALLQSIPGRSSRKAALKVIAGSVPDPLAEIGGCAFHPRCEQRQEAICELGGYPVLAPVSDGHWCACHTKAGAP